MNAQLKLVQPEETIASLRNRIRHGEFTYGEVNDMIGQVLDQRMELVHAGQVVPLELQELQDMLLVERSDVMTGRPPVPSSGSNDDPSGWMGM